MKATKLLIGLIVILTSLLLPSACSDDDYEMPADGYGFVQFKLLKNGGLTVQEKVGSRAADADRLDSLAEAKKLKITLKSNYAVIEQTLALTAVNGSETELGLWSEKCRLMAGSYRIAGYELLDNLGHTILTYDQEVAESFSIVQGGMEVQSIYVNVRPRGLAKFHLVKDLSHMQTRAEVKEYYHMAQVKKASLVIEHQKSGERTRLDKMNTQLVYYYDSAEGGEPLHSRLECDTIVPLKAGEYKVISYQVFDKGDKELQIKFDLAENCFTVEDSRTAIAKVPITLEETAAYIRDGRTLRALWEALDGPNWYYRGDLFAEGANWDFNKDIDMWTFQPGVTIQADGRVASITLGGFGAKGDMPECIGDLESLESLALGYHTDGMGSSPFPPNDASVDELIKSARADYDLITTADYFPLKADKALRESFTPGMKQKLERAEKAGNFTAAGLDAHAKNSQHFSTLITSLPSSIGKLKKLRSLFVANCPIKEFPKEISQLPNCTDVEIYNCPNLTEVPAGLKDMPKLTALFFVNNQGISGDNFYNELKLWNESRVSNTLQVLIGVNNNLPKVPDLSKMKKLTTLNFQNNQVTEFEAPFGRKHYLRTINMANNKLKSLPVDAEGYFGDYLASETWNFSMNEFTEFPNIFGLEGQVTTIDFSGNKITSVQGGEKFRGVIAEILGLGYNELEEFPKEFYNSGSAIIYLSARGNGMRKISKKALEGKHVYSTTTLDLADNRLNELPDNFSNITFPYMTALDMSGNAFESYPWRAMNLSNLAVFLLRAQRNDEGFRCMKEWPVGIGNHHGMSSLILSGNDIRKVDDNELYKIRFYVDLTDNPNITIDLTKTCPYIMQGLLYFLFSPGQDVRGCDAVLPKNN